MKRKVNRVGTNTLTVSLPNKWVKSNNLKKSDELEVTEIGNNLMLGKEYSPQLERCHIDVSGQQTMIHRIIAALYKAGYDEVTIKYADSEELEIIQDRLQRNLPEFDIFEYRQNEVIIKAISKLEPKEFGMVFKRLIFTMKDIAHDSFRAISENNYVELRSIAIRDKSVDKYSDFCRRLLNKYVVTEFKRKKCIYSLIEEIEIIGDMYKELCNEISNKKIEVSNELKVLFKEITDFFYYFSDLLFKFNLEKVKILGVQREQLKKKIEPMYAQIEKKEMRVFFIIVQIFDATFEMKSALLTELL
jgi:phosphate uptake regulator